MDTRGRDIPPGDGSARGGPCVLRYPRPSHRASALRVVSGAMAEIAPLHRWRPLHRGERDCAVRAAIVSIWSTKTSGWVASVASAVTCSSFGQTTSATAPRLRTLRRRAHRWLTAPAQPHSRRTIQQVCRCHMVLPPDVEDSDGPCTPPPIALVKGAKRRAQQKNGA